MRSPAETSHAQSSVPQFDAGSCGRASKTSGPLRSCGMMAQATVSLGTQDFAPPFLPIFVIERTHLIERLNRSAVGYLTVVTAPAGYGKSVLFAQWYDDLAAQGNCIPVWLTLRKADGSPEEFMRRLYQSIVSASNHHTGQKPSVTGDIDIATLSNVIYGMHKKIFILLDGDYADVSEPELDDFIRIFIEKCGSRIHLAISSRTKAALATAKLRAAGLVNEVGPSDLLFNADETRSLIEDSVGEEAARHIHSSTAGWPIAIRFAAATSADHACGKLLAEYIKLELLAGRSLDWKELLDASVVDEFNDDLLKILFGDAYNHSRDVLMEGGLPVEVARRPGWWRLPQTLLLTLRAELNRKNPARAQQLHQKAAVWFARHGDDLNAIHHALRCGDQSLIDAVVAPISRWEALLERGVDHAASILAKLDSSAIDRMPNLRLMSIGLNIFRGNFIAALDGLKDFKRLEQDVLAIHDRDLGVLSLLTESMTISDPDRTAYIQRVQARLTSLDVADAVGRCILLYACAVASHRACRYNDAIGYLDEALEIARQRNLYAGIVYMLLQTGLTRYSLGQVTNSEAVYGAAVALAEQHFGSESSPCAVGNVLLAQVHCIKGRYDEASDLLDNALRHDVSLFGVVDVSFAIVELGMILGRRSIDAVWSTKPLLKRLEQRVIHHEDAGSRDYISAWKIAILLDQEDVGSATKFILQNDIEARFERLLDRPFFWRQATFYGYALARWHSLTGELSAGLAILERVKLICGGNSSALDHSRVKTYELLLRQQQGEVDTAVTLLGEVLDYIELEGATCIVQNFGEPIKAVLRLATKQDTKTRYETRRWQLIQHLTTTVVGGPRWLSLVLTEREAEILLYLNKDLSNKRIGQILALSENTIKFHVKRLFKKLNVSSRQEAVSVSRSEANLADFGYST